MSEANPLAHPGAAMEGEAMTFEPETEPRCPRCEHVLPGAGAICHVCDVESHFEGLFRTAPPLFMNVRREEPEPRSDLQAS
ncbi:MAG: hypothetical protein JWM86_2516 [Thermoleophilia bacterium]|nr:hypothetical protein [Thermoleophilia bacterium]